ncbi:MAG: M20/M25/M40 family metallo-hydrolase, partial [Candidatus Korarchaeum sp.]|nr:M20/M25/M40 family metallo-hydrolase [Candidatus Korarchaeum sp.]
RGLVDFLRELVRTRSLPGEERELAGLVREELLKLGVDSVRIDHAGNVVAWVRRSGEGLVLLDAHMDTVPEGSDWLRDPLSGDIVNGYVYGRGSVDMKGGLAAIVYSVPLVSEEGSDLVYAFVVHEEDQEGFGVRQVISSLHKLPDLVIIGEPTSLNLARGHRGRAEVIVELRGRSSHSSMPELGDNCLERACEYLTYLRSIELPSHGVLGRATVAPVRIDANPGLVPVVPDRCTLLLDRRTVEGESKESIEEQLKGKILRKEVRCYTGYGEEVEAWFPAWLNKDPSLLKLAERLGGELITWRFSTDGSYTAGELGIPTIGFGPGDQEMAHRSDEMVPLEEVGRAAELYPEILRWFHELQVR